MKNSKQNEELLKKLKELEANNNLLTKTIQGLKDKPENKEINQEEIFLFNCYHCKQNQNLSLLVLELPQGKLCQDCWKLLRNKTKEDLKEKSLEIQSFACHNCHEKKKESKYQVRLDSSDKLYSICTDCLPKIKEYNEAESKSDRELDLWE